MDVPAIVMDNCMIILEVLRLPTSHMNREKDDCESQCRVKKLRSRSRLVVCVMQHETVLCINSEMTLEKYSNSLSEMR